MRCRYSIHTLSESSCVEQEKLALKQQLVTVPLRDPVTEQLKRQVEVNAELSNERVEHRRAIEQAQAALEAESLVRSVPYMSLC